MTFTRRNFEVAVLQLVLLFVVAFLVLFGFAAHAQTVLGNPAPASSSLLAGLLTLPNVVAAIGAVLALVGGFQFFSEKRKRILALAVDDGFHIVEDVYNELDDGPAKEAFRKADEGLKAVNAWLIANKWRPLRPSEAAAVAMQLQATHGQEIAKEKIAVAAAQAGA